MSAAAGEIVKKAIKRGAAYDLGASIGVGKKIVGRQWRKAATRSERSAMLANAAVGAVGGGLYGYTQGDWKGGAMMGGVAGAGYWMAGGRRGMGLMARKGGFLQKNTARAIEKKAAGQAVGQQAAQGITSTGARTGRWDNVGWVQNAKQRQADTATAAAATRQAEVQRIRKTVDSPEWLMNHELAAHQRSMAGAAQRRGSLNRALNQEHNADYATGLAARSSRSTAASQQKRSRKLRGRRG